MKEIETVHWSTFSVVMRCEPDIWLPLHFHEYTEFNTYYFMGPEPK